MDAKVGEIGAIPEEYTGSDCSGSDSDANRILTLANTKTTKTRGFQVFVEGLLQYDADITVTHNASNSTVQFTKELWDIDRIKVFYLT